MLLFRVVLYDIVCVVLPDDARFCDVIAAAAPSPSTEQCVNQAPQDCSPPHHVRQLPDEQTISSPPENKPPLPDPMAVTPPYHYHHQTNEPHKRAAYVRTASTPPDKRAVYESWGASLLPERTQQLPPLMMLLSPQGAGDADKRAAEGD